MKIEYDKVIVRECGTSVSREWVDLSTLISGAPGKVQIMHSAEGDFVMDACSLEEFEAGEGEPLLDRIDTCETLVNITNEITKENNEPPIVKFPVMHIVDSVEGFIKLGKRLTSLNIPYAISCNETLINKKL